MARMIALDPAIEQALPCERWKLIATEAGRYADGLRATIQVWNGEPQASQQLALAQSESWGSFVEKIATLTGVIAEEIEKAILTLAAGVEGQLRQMAGHGRATPRAEFPHDANDGADPFERWTDGRQGEYEVEQGQFFRWVTVRDTPVRKLISNFTARVVEDVTRDDGAEEQHWFVLEGRLWVGDAFRSLPRREVAAHQFDGLTWLAKAWGVEPAVLPGQKEHVPYVIRLFSGQVPRRVIYGHLGWRHVDAAWADLHAGGTVGVAGVEVEVGQDGLTRYALPGDDGDVWEAMRVSLQLLGVAEPRVAYPMWALPWRAVVCELLPCPIMPHAVGPTGQLKSTLAAAVLAHFGPFRTKEDLPARWEFTDNILEKVTFLAKDVLVVFDDLNPETSKARKDDLERRFSRLAGDVGNLTGRRRMRRDYGTRLEYRPRGLVLSTGEYTPLLAQSRLARIFPIPFNPGAVDTAALAAVQRRLDVLPYALRGFIERLRGDFAAHGEKLRGRFEQLRERAAELGRLHARLPENVAHLFLGLELGIGFALELQVLDEKTATRHLETGWDVFMALAREHGRLIGEERPTQAFLAAITEALAVGKAWLANRHNGHPVAGEANPGAEKLGWADQDGIYLLPATSFALASSRLSYRGGIHITDLALRQLLEQEGYLVRDTSEPERLVVNRRCQGKVQRVLWLKPDALGEGSAS